MVLRDYTFLLMLAVPAKEPVAEVLFGDLSQIVPDAYKAVFAK
jgi:hypothetical protein